MKYSSKGRPASARYITRPAKFTIVGMSGVITNMGVYSMLLGMGAHPAYASVAAVEASVLSNFALNDLWTFRDRRNGRMEKRLLLFHLSRALGAAVNIAAVAALTALGVEPVASNAVGIALAVAANYATSDRVVWRVG